MDLNESIEWIRNRADQTRFGLEVWWNVQVTTFTHYNGIDYRGTDLVDITDKYRAMGVIK